MTKFDKAQIKEERKRKKACERIRAILDFFTFSYQPKQPPDLLYKNAVLKSWAIFTGKHLCWS